MRIVQDKTFTNETVELDETRFINCKFENCVITWTGRPAALDGGTISADTRFEFGGTAGRVVGLLNVLGMIRPVYRIESPSIN